jgi:glutamyl-tRNA reductase
MLAAGRDPREVVEFLAATLTNRLMHAPSHHLREAAEHGDDEIVRAVQSLFGSESVGHESLGSNDTATGQEFAPPTDAAANER